MILGKVHFEKKDSLPIETLWVKNKLAFDSETLENVALKIERWYGVKVDITDERLKSYEYHAVFDDESLQQVMDALSSTGNFKYTINKKEVTIAP
jgi:transmembrane sensor